MATRKSSRRPRKLKNLPEKTVTSDHSRQVKGGLIGMLLPAVQKVRESALGAVFQKVR